MTSVKTLAAYYKKSPDTIADEQIREWLLHLIRVRKLSGSSVNCAVQAVRAFQEWVLGRERADTVRAVPRTRRPTTRAEVYAPTEIAALLAAAPQWRDRVFLTIVYACGLRLAEAQHLQTRDIDAARLQLRGQPDGVRPWGLGFIGVSCARPQRAGASRRSPCG